MMLRIIALVAVCVLVSASRAQEISEYACTPGSVAEGEPDCGYPVDTVNGGCATEPPVYSVIECGQRVCGTSRAGGGHKDYDEFALTLEYPTEITWSGTARFDFRLHILDWNPDCVSGAPIDVETGDTGETVTTTAVLNAGSYIVAISPISKWDDIPCGTPWEAELTCVPLMSGACCFEDGSCLSNWAAEPCAQEGGTFAGAGTECATAVCPTGPGACCLLDGTCADDILRHDCETVYNGVFAGAGLGCAEAACCVLPTAGEFEREGEPIVYDGYVDEYNDACDDSPEFHAAWIESSAIVVGHSGTYLDSLDTPRGDMDVFAIDASAYEWYTWRVTADFPVEIGLVRGSTWSWCDWSWEYTASAPACESAIVSAALPVGSDNYAAAYVRPQAGATVPCGSAYVAELTTETADCLYTRRGDANCDDHVDAFDIDPFVIALAQGESAWESAVNPGYWCTFECVNDCNHDGVVNAFDIDPFVELLVGGG